MTMPRPYPRHTPVRTATVLFAVGLVAACGSSATGTGSEDAGSDVTQVGQDSGSHVDAHTTRDAGMNHDTGAGHDTGLGDTGIPVDTGAPVDTGLPDASTAHDAGSSCTDGVKNGNETAIDCGGGTCAACPDSSTCKATTDCLSGVCTGGICAPPACSPTCPDANLCGADGDCASGVCTAGVCGAPACSPTCGTGATCALKSDCASGVCTQDKCVAPTDTDTVKNGGETDTDCGGALLADGTVNPASDGAPPCGDTHACLLGSDCKNLICDPTAHTCTGASCSDGVRNGDETGTDCGGATGAGGCPPCADSVGCVANADCESGVCTMNKCAPPACASTCPNGNVCGANTDCASGVCTAGKCAPPACATACTLGAACGANSDCASLDCASAVCVNPVSCAALLAANPGLASGAYTIQPTGAAAAFTAYCDMTDNGGGWTLVAKMNGSSTIAQGSQNFTYASLLWTNTTLLNATSNDLTQTEAKLQAYLSVPFTNILGMMAGATATNTLVIPAADATSMQDLIANTPSNTLLTNLGRTAWVDFTNPTSAPQANCNKDGINLIPFTGAVCTGSQLSNTARVRIGMLANQENDCCSPDSYVGFGGDYYYNASAACTVAPSAGSLGGSCYGGGASVYDFGYLFVR